jgi:hypothetical protein
MEFIYYYVVVIDAMEHFLENITIIASSLNQNDPNDSQMDPLQNK